MEGHLTQVSYVLNPHNFCKGSLVSCSIVLTVTENDFRQPLQ